MTYPCYGLYLIPPPALMYPFSLAHQVLAAEFGAKAAGKFMVHCTVKGFTKLADGATPADFLPDLDALFARLAAFSTGFSQVYTHKQAGSSPSVLAMLERAGPIMELEAGVRGVVQPFIAPDCRFSWSEGTGPTFYPHFTLGMADVPSEPGLLVQFEGLCNYLFENMPSGPFLAADLQLIEFHSDNWNGPWWDTLSYKQLKGWRLRDGSVSS